MKRLAKAILKTILVLVLILMANFILDLIAGIATWIAPVLLVLAIIGLVAMYYFEGKEDKQCK